jgi:hypothetical protein
MQAGLALFNAARSEEDAYKMKLNDLHAGHGIREEETVTTNFPAPAFTESKPKGVNIGQHDAHIDSSGAKKGSGESRTTGAAKKPNVNSQSEARAGS